MAVFCVAVCGFFSPAHAQVVQPTCGAPVKSHNGTSFGCRNAGVPGASKFHKGTDYLCTSGSPLKAYLTGNMTCTPRLDGNGAGNRCAIVGQGANSCLTIKYFHMDDTGFLAGARAVTLGQSIGTSGASGKGLRVKWGAHLHFEIWVDGRPIGAQYYFSKYANANVCANNAMKTDLWDNADADMASCPGEPGSGPGIPGQNQDDSEVANEGDDACMKPEGLPACIGSSVVPTTGGG